MRSRTNTEHGTESETTEGLTEDEGRVVAPGEQEVTVCSWGGTHRVGVPLGTRVSGWVVNDRRVGTRPPTGTRRVGTSRYRHSLRSATLHTRESWRTHFWRVRLPPFKVCRVGHYWEGQTVLGPDGTHQRNTPITRMWGFLSRFHKRKRVLRWMPSDLPFLGVFCHPLLTRHELTPARDPTKRRILTRGSFSGEGVSGSL